MSNRDVYKRQDAQRDGVDKGLVKRIVLLTLMVAVVIAGCVVALYLL